MLSIYIHLPFLFFYLDLNDCCEISLLVKNFNTFNSRMVCAHELLTVTTCTENTSHWDLSSTSLNIDIYHTIKEPLFLRAVRTGMPHISHSVCNLYLFGRMKWVIDLYNLHSGRLDIYGTLMCACFYLEFGIYVKLLIKC